MIVSCCSLGFKFLWNSMDFQVWLVLYWVVLILLLRTEGQPYLVTRRHIFYLTEFLASISSLKSARWLNPCVHSTPFPPQARVEFKWLQQTSLLLTLSRFSHILVCGSLPSTLGDHHCLLSCTLHKENCWCCRITIDNLSNIQYKE